MIGLHEVTIRYPGATALAVDAVSLEARRGLMTAVVGPNGSGKSTLVRALIRRVPLTAGRLTIASDDVSTLARDALARRVAVVAQREDLAFPVTVAEYTALGRFPHVGVWRALTAHDREAIARAMRETGVDVLADRPVDALSGGEWQRVRLARALAQAADALVLDEPTAFLDVSHEMGVFELLHRLARDGRAVLLVSHQLNLVARFADHIVLLDRGRVAASGSPDDVMQPAILERVYDWPLVVTRDPAVGAPALVPLRSRSRPSTP